MKKDWLESAWDDSKKLEKNQDMMNKYCESKAYLLAQKIDDKFTLVVKPRPKYCPEWLYKKIIKDSVEIIQSKWEKQRYE